MYSDIPVFPLDTPAFRPVELIPARMQGQPVLVIKDPTGVIENTPVIVPNPMLLLFMELADGQTSCAEMASRVSQATGQLVPAAAFESMAKQLDEALLLQSERFRGMLVKRHEDYMKSPTRPCTLFRAEGMERLEMMKGLGEEFRRHQAGAAAPPAQLDLPRASVAAVLAPHIDYDRGGHAYAWAYKAIRENGIGARTWIILGTCHHPTTHRFVATRKSFETPFGTIETDGEVLDKLAREFGGELFHDEYAHAREHTVELQAIYMKKTFDGQSAPKIVPILVSSFDDLMEDGKSPKDDTEIAAFCTALRRVLDDSAGAVGLIGGVDFSHCGPAFGDEELVEPDVEKRIESADRAVLAAIESGDPERFFALVSRDVNPTNICSSSSIYCVMEAMRDRAVPRVLTYQQNNSEDKSCLVSFASVAFINKDKAAQSPRILIVPG